MNARVSKQINTQIKKEFSILRLRIMKTEPVYSNHGSDDISIVNTVFELNEPGLGPEFTVNWFNQSINCVTQNRKHDLDYDLKI